VGAPSRHGGGERVPDEKVHALAAWPRARCSTAASAPALRCVEEIHDVALSDGVRPSSSANSAPRRRSSLSCSPRSTRPSRGYQALGLEVEPAYQAYLGSVRTMARP